MSEVGCASWRILEGSGSKTITHLVHIYSSCVQFQDCARAAEIRLGLTL